MSGPPNTIRIGSVVNGKWQIDAKIGTGGMATVFAVTHRAGHRAALKLLHAQLSRDASTRARFLREGYAANAVGHPGVVSVLDDGIAEDGSAFLVLELLEGETMEARRMRLGGSLPLEEVLAIADDALGALAAAHDKGIIHRDVKPENVFLTNDGHTKLLDFGLARILDDSVEITATGVTIGTPEFMPPEQAMGRRGAVDPRSDVWGLGATLYTSITGRYVHEDANSLREQLVASATRRPTPLRQFAPHVAPAVASVVDRALELEMSDRWSSAAEMKAALRSARAMRTSGPIDTGSSTMPTASVRNPPPHHASGPWSAAPPSRPLPAPNPPPFRAPLVTPSAEHETVPGVAADPHAATVATSGPITGAGEALEPTLAIASHPPPPAHVHAQLQVDTLPLSIPPYASPPEEAEDPRAATMRNIIFAALGVAIFFLVVGAYVLWRRTAM